MTGSNNGVRWSKRVELGHILQIVTIIGAVGSAMITVVWMEAARDSKFTIVNQRIEQNEKAIADLHVEIRDARGEARDGIKQVEAYARVYLDGISKALNDLRVVVAGPSHDGRR